MQAELISLFKFDEEFTVVEKQLKTTADRLFE